jgi:hypothetical protein
MLDALMYYNCLLTFCFYELDVLIKSDDVLMNVHASQEIHVFNKPPCNGTIDALSEKDAYAWTQFHKHQLRLLMVHLCIPNIVVGGPRQRYRFSGEELLAVCLSFLATGDPWTRLIPIHFGGDVRCLSAAFHWFINNLFIKFYHKISGQSIEGWLRQVKEFKRVILDRLAQPAHPIQLDYDDELTHPQFIIQCPIENWRVFRFLDDTNVRTCSPGSGPVGNRGGPGQPQRQFADLIQRAFNR